MAGWETERRELWEVTREMLHSGLVSGASGNASLRLPPTDGQELIAITPTRLPYSRMTAEDIVVIDMEGEPVEGKLVPSSETPMHLAIYRRRADVRAIVHTHSIFASVVAVAGKEIPPLIDEMVLVAGGAVRVAEYAFPGTEELAENVCAALGTRQAALLRNHGLVGVGSSAQEALEVCHLVERVAQIFVYAALLGAPRLLPDDVVRAEEELFRMRQEAQAQEESTT